MAVTDRDEKIIEFVTRFGAANQRIIEMYAFGKVKSAPVISRRRLTRIVAAGRLKRWRLDQSQQYIYYVKTRPQRMEHALLIAEWYARIVRIVGEDNIIEFDARPDWGTIKPDAFVVIRWKGFRLVALEVERMKGTGTAVGKWEEYVGRGEWRKKFPAAPMVALWSPKPIDIPKDTPVKYVPMIGATFEGISNILY